jgi:hypothetical protein
MKRMLQHYPIAKTLVNTSINFEGQRSDCLFANKGADE